MRRSWALRLGLPGLLGLGLLGLVACGAGDVPVGDGAEIANPASVYCEEQGGTVEIIDTDGGQVGICVLDDGRECEEWAYYRRGACVPGTDQAMTTVEVHFSNETLGDPCGEVFPVARPWAPPVVATTSAHIPDGGVQHRGSRGQLLAAAAMSSRSAASALRVVPAKSRPSVAAMILPPTPEGCPAKVIVRSVPPPSGPMRNSLR